MSATRLQGLDALRGIAALCVVMLHANAVFRQVPPWFAFGYLGVDFFLMLSGYLMARFTEPRLAAGASPTAFLRSRYWRFWPVVALGSVIGIPYLWVRTQGDPGWFGAALIANMLMLPWPADRLLFPLNVPIWTILFELLANALHVLVLWRLPTRWLCALIVAAFGLTVIAAAQYGSLNVGARPENVIYAPPRVLFAYGLGVLLWRWRGERLSAPLPAWLALAAMPAAMVAFWASGAPAWPLDLAFVAVLCPLVIVGALGIVRDTAPGRLSRDLSFPLFAAHVPALEAVRLAGYGPLAGFVAALLAALLIMLWTQRGSDRLRAKSTAM